jgi:hypothetical protein
VRTLDSWCYDLIGSFPQLSGVALGDEPDWRMSPVYHQAGASTSRSSAVRRMLEASYELIVVDEYQDCQQWQHGLVLALAERVPTIVFGDRLQGLFFFGDNQPVRWENDVLPHFPAIEVAVTPWRWTANPALGAWLLDARRGLLSGTGVNLDAPGVRRVERSETVPACIQQPRHPARTVAIAKWPNDCQMLARRLGGGYTMIEEVEGRFLLAFADVVDRGQPAEVASAAVEFSVDCAFGVAQLFDTAARQRLLSGRPLAAPRFAAVLTQRDAVNALLDDPAPSSILRTLRALGQLEEFRLYRREAWYGTLSALRLCETTEGLTMRQAVVQTRNQLRTQGRYPESRILARPLLIKGLEFDYAVVTDAESLNAHELYVCLTRGSMGVTVASDALLLNPQRPG